MLGNTFLLMLGYITVGVEYLYYYTESEDES